MARRRIEPAPLVLTIPGKPPSKANRYRIAGGRFYADRAVHDYERVIARILADGQVAPLEGFVDVTIHTYPPDLRSDLTGGEKLVLDALQAEQRVKVGEYFRVIRNKWGAYVNDRQVRRFEMEFIDVDKVNPRIVVTVRPYSRRLAPP